jgi:hypothetical protein
MHERGSAGMTIPMPQCGIVTTLNAATCCSGPKCSPPSVERAILIV